jgi:hypothetical protein
MEIVTAGERHAAAIEGLAPGDLLHRWIASLAKSGINALHDDVVDFAALVKGRLP